MIPNRLVLCTKTSSSLQRCHLSPAHSRWTHSLRPWFSGIWLPKPMSFQRAWVFYFVMFIGRRQMFRDFGFIYRKMTRLFAEVMYSEVQGKSDLAFVRTNGGIIRRMVARFSSKCSWLLYDLVFPCTFVIFSYPHVCTCSPSHICICSFFHTSTVHMSVGR